MGFQATSPGLTGWLNFCNLFPSIYSMQKLKVPDLQWLDAFSLELPPWPWCFPQLQVTDISCPDVVNPMMTAPRQLHTHGGHKKHCEILSRNFMLYALRYWPHQHSNLRLNRECQKVMGIYLLLWYLIYSFILSGIVYQLGARLSGYSQTPYAFLRDNDGWQHEGHYRLFGM